MRITQQLVVFDAPDLALESSFWAALLGGTVEADDVDWHISGRHQLAARLAGEPVAT